MAQQTDNTRPFSSTSFKTKIRDDHLTCTICYNSFVKPKALPCIHTFCENCLRDFVTGRGYDKDGRFPCPLCRAVITIPTDGVAGFPSNHMVQSLLDTVDVAQRRPAPPPPLPPRSNRNRIDLGNAENVAPPLQIDSTSRGNLNGMGAVNTDQPFSTDATLGAVQCIYPQLPTESPTEIQEQPSLSNVPCCDNMIQKFGAYGSGLSNFHKPYGLAVNLAGEILISDLGGNRIFRFSRRGELLSKFVCDCTVKDITSTADNDVLVAVSKSGSSIMRLYDQQTGRLKSKYGTFYRYDNPSGIALTPSNYALVTGLENNVVYVFTEQRNQSCKFGHKGSGNDHFNHPQFVTSNSKNQIIISDTGNNCIKLYDITGKFKHRLGSEGSQHGNFSKPLGICTDSRGNLIVADSGNFRVEVFSSKGKFVTSIVENTDRITPGVQPVHVAVTPDDNIVVLLVGNQFAEVRVYTWKPASVVDADSCSACLQQ